MSERAERQEAHRLGDGGGKKEDKELNWGNLSANGLPSTPQPAESVLLKPVRNLSKLCKKKTQTNSQKTSKQAGRGVEREKHQKSTCHAESVKQSDGERN